MPSLSPITTLDPILHESHPSSFFETGSGSKALGREVLTVMRSSAAARAVVALDEITTFGDPWLSLLLYWPSGTGWSYPVARSSAPASVTTPAYSPGQMLAAIRAHLSLTITETASALQVERPTVYAWLRGQWEPHEQNRRRLHRLFDLAFYWSRGSKAPLGTRLRDADARGTSLLDLLRAERWDEARNWLTALWKVGPVPTPGQPLSVREALARHGLSSRVPRGAEEIDRVTGKRLGPE